MAGGFAKGLGITFLILGGTLLLAGLAAAGFGYFTLADQESRGLFADEDAQEQSEVLLVGGAIAGGVGLLLLLLGGILVGVGGARARAELLRAVGAKPTPAPAVAPPVETPTATPHAPHATPRKAPRERARRPLVAVLAILAVVLLAGLAYAALAPEGAPSVSAAGFGGAPPQEPDAEPTVETFDGRVQGARAPLVGGLNTMNSESIHELTLAPGPYALVATLNWTTGGPAGAQTLVLLLEAETAEGWSKLARAEGGPGTMIELSSTELPAHVRARVFAGGTGAVDQAYTLEVVATPG